MKMVDTKMGKAGSIAKEGYRVNATGRRTYAEEFKRSMVKECLAPGVSVAGTGLKHGINPNLLRRWIRKAQAAMVTPSTPVLLPVTIGRAQSQPQAIEEAPRSSRTSGGCIEIEIGAARIRVRGAVDVCALRCVLSELRRP